MYSLTDGNGEFVAFFDTHHDAMMHAITQGVASPFTITDGMKG